MKRLLTIALVTLPLFAACKKDKAGGAPSDKPAESGTAAPVKDEGPIALTDTVDIGAAITDPDDTGYQGLKVMAPKGATVEAGLTGVMVKTGDNGFEISKAYDPGYVAKIKGEAQADTLDKLVKFHLDTADAILWESKSELGGNNDFNFAAEVSVGDAKYKCGNKGYGQFTRAQAEAQLKSCQSLTK